MLLAAVWMCFSTKNISASASGRFAGLSWLQVSSQLLAASPIETPANSWRSMPIAEDSPTCRYTDSKVQSSAQGLLLTSADV